MKNLISYDDSDMRSDLAVTEKVSPQALREAHASALRLHKEGKQGWLDILDDMDHLQAIDQAARRFGRHAHCLVLGIGGSDLGARAVLAALEPVKGKTRLWFAGDTTDPDEIAKVLDAVPWKQACINVISKSGGTLETMAVFFEAKRRLEKAVGIKKAGDRIICTTDPEKSALRDLALDKGWATLSVPPNIGGRFSVLSAVGLFPLALAGVDVKKLLKGAVSLRDEWMEHQGASHQVDRFAAWQYAHESRKNRNMHVLFAYAANLRSMSNWWRQIWAESLGKAIRSDGSKNKYGPTPVVAIGPTDQHSQLQLYQEGPDDKIYTFLTVKSPKTRLSVPSSIKSLSLVAYASGRPFSALIAAEAQGSMSALRQAKRPLGHLQLQKVDESTLGALLVFYELATAVAGELYGINAYDQPGVEASKKRAHELLTRP
jgi:glucose-6-phosphate isomerase